MREKVEQCLKFGGWDLKKKWFHCSKKAVNLNKVNIEKVLIFDEFTYVKKQRNGCKYFIGYKTDQKITPLFIKLQQMTGFFNKFEKTDYISFVVED